VTGGLTGVVAVVVFVLAAVLGDLCSKEIRGRLDRVPGALLRMAARRLPSRVREQWLEEWRGELYEILRGADALPVTRLWRGLRYGLGVVRAAPSVVPVQTAAPASTHLFLFNVCLMIAPLVGLIRVDGVLGFVIKFGVINLIALIAAVLGRLLQERRRAGRRNEPR
jgi:hypothetical protein